MEVDWRNRYGYNWITSIRNQGGTENCWAFAMTAMYEAMVRIEQKLWCRLSEGDVARGAGKQPWDLGNPSEAGIFANRYGIADPDCFPWGEDASLYIAKEGGVNLDAIPVSPTPDRAGRTVRVGAVTTLTDVQQKKSWIDVHGPMALMFQVPAGFGTMPGTVFDPPAGTAANGPFHALLVVGYSDSNGYWICKNSYGPGWMESGFIRISYHSGLLEGLQFLGVTNTNPSPHFRRRHRNGVLLQSGNGSAFNNFELFLKKGTTLGHWWRDNGTAGLPWFSAGIIASVDPYRPIYDIPLDMPACIQSTYNRNFELVYRSQRTDGGTPLKHIYFDQAHGWWLDLGSFGPASSIGIPGFIQSNRGAPGDFVVAILNTSGVVEQWVKQNSSPWTYRPGHWYLKTTFASALRYAGPALVHSRAGLSPDSDIELELGEYHYVGTNTSGSLVHYINHQPNSVSSSWQQSAAFGTKITSGPCMIESQNGTVDEQSVGNLELCVVNQAGQIEYWTYVRGPSVPVWKLVNTFGSAGLRVIGLLQSTFNFNFELILERTDGRFQHYYYDGTQWVAGVIIV